LVQISDSPWLRSVSRPGAIVFALLFVLESLARATLLTVIPLQAYALLGEAREVSLLYVLVGITGLASSFTIPLLIRRFRRRWVYAMGAALLIATAALLATRTLPGQALAMLCRAVAAAALNITLSLYVMDYIRKRDLVRSEPLRMGFSGVAWAIGPLLGVTLYEKVGHGGAELASACFSSLLLLYFPYLGLTDNRGGAAATRPVADPRANIRRFLSQPRLRLAWYLAFARSVYWSMFFTYPPVYFVQQGIGGTAAGALASAGNALLLLAPLVGRVAGRTGLRRPIMAAMVGAGTMCVVAAVGYHLPWLVAASLLCGAVGAVTLDALANIPFLRSVHPYERPQMTTVFRTYIDLSDLLPAMLYSVLLIVFDLRAVFVTTALIMLSGALMARFLPRRM
jgi:MFS family permease